MKHACAISIAVLIGLALPARAQDAPPPDILNRIIDSLGKPEPRVPPVFEQAGTGAPDPVCGLQSFGMTLAKGTSRQRRYVVLADEVAPKQMLVRISRLSVDADGSERAYHPEDPFGRGICTREKGPGGQDKLAGICALDAFSSSGLRLYLDAKQIQLMTKADDENIHNPDFNREWKVVWPQIRDRQLKAFTLESLTTRSVPPFYYLFYDKARKTTALLKNNIIPTDQAGYPCLRGAESRYPGYFVAATTLQTNGAKARGDGCTPLSFIDAEVVPFFVLPHAATGRIGIGDIVIGHLKTTQGERLVYGFAADIGPAGQFGEASYAFARRLRADIPETPMNVIDVYKADIGPSWLRTNNASLSVLALGGTKALLRGDYSKPNIERVGREQFAKWNGDAGAPTRRLNACVAQAEDNPAH
jgi:hypothetical protein